MRDARWVVMFVLLAIAGFCGLIVVKNVLYADGAPIRSALTDKVPAKQINGAEQTYTMVCFNLEYKEDKPTLRPAYLTTGDNTVVIRPKTRLLLPGRKLGEPATLWRVEAGPTDFYNVSVTLVPETFFQDVKKHTIELPRDAMTQFVLDIGTVSKTISELAD